MGLGVDLSLGVGYYLLSTGGRSSVVEHLVANENVESSNLFARSIFVFGGRDFGVFARWEFLSEVEFGGLVIWTEAGQRGPVFWSESYGKPRFSIGRPFVP